MEISVPKQAYTFTFHDGRSHEVSLLAAHQAAYNDDTIAKFKETKNFEYLDYFCAWWKANAKDAHGGEAVISRDEAYYLLDVIPVELDQQKKTRLAPLKLSNSTEETLTPLSD